MSVYVPPAASTGDSCSGGCGTTADNKYQYLRGYFNAHMLSMPSHRYEYITWLTLALVILITAAFYHAGISDQSYIGAAWSRWAVKTRVIKFGRKEAPSTGRHQGSFSTPPKRRKVLSFTSFGKTLLLLAMIIVPIVLTIVGADYIRPSAGVFDMRESWPNSTISPFTAGLNRRLLWGQGSYPRVTTNPPSITLPYRTWWTAGGRTGAMTNALTPFIVVIALKQIPFALLSTKLLGGLAFDRLSFMHKWGGRVVWLFATAHIALWSIQLSRDRAFGGTMWAFVFMWTKFRWGWVSYGFFTCLVLLSIGPIRSNYYEFFYVAHVVCAVGFMVTAWLHHPPLGAWMYATLLWWLAERVVRALKVAYVNGIGFAGRRKAHVAVQQQRLTHAKASSFHSRHVAGQKSMSAASSYTMHSDSKSDGTPYKQSFAMSTQPRQQVAHDQQRLVNNNVSVDRTMTQKGAQYDPVYDVIDGYTGTEQGIPMHDMHPRRYSLQDGGPTLDPTAYAPSALSQSSDPTTVREGQALSPFHASADRYLQSSTELVARSRQPRPSMAADVAAVLRPGFAYAQLLPGKTLRLTLRTPNRFAWQPGQYVNLNTPSVRWWQSHPFTVASAYNADYPSSTEFREEDAEKGVVSRDRGGAERTIVLLLRARKGFTHFLWDYVRVEREKQIRQIEETTGMQYSHGEVAKTATGVHLRAIIDGPFGSASRTRWGIHSTVVIICGGSGISYGTSVLEHLCAVMAGIKEVRNFQTRRVRFVWILREYSHLQWIASALRRCVEMVPPEMLQVDLYVTSSRAVRHQPHASQDALNSMHDISGGGADARTLTPGHSYDEGFARFTEGPDQEEYDVDAYALTQFEGEDYSAPTAAEAKISARVHNEGRLRRAHTRKVTMKRKKQQHVPTANNARRGTPGMPSNDSVAFAAQSAIYHRTHPSIATSLPPQAEVPRRRDRTGKYDDLGDRTMPEDELWHVRDYEQASVANASSQRWPAPEVHVQPSSPYIHTPTGSYFGARSGSPVPLPGSTSPLATPDGGGGAMLSPDVYGEGGGMHGSSSTNLLHPATAASSTTYLNSTSPHQGPSLHGPSHLAQPMYSDGAELAQMPSGPDVPIDLDEGENADMGVIAELARAGYPKLDRIIREEADRSVGRVLVSACGPSSLGTLIRSIVSKQIDLRSLRQGKLNAHINVATESYEWGG